MNTILLDGTKEYSNDGIVRLELDKDSVIDIKSDMTVYLTCVNQVKVICNVYSEASIYNLSLSNLVVDINLYNSANVKYYLQCITNQNITNEVNVNHLYKNTTSNLVCHGISYDRGNLKFIVNGNIKKGIVDSFCNEESRIITFDDACGIIEPNLFIDEFNSNAIHSAYIGPFNYDTLFYLECKGIKRSEALNLLLRGFIIPNQCIMEYEKEISRLLNNVIRR